MKILKILAAALIPAALLAGCASGGEQVADIDPSDAVKAVIAEVPITSGIENDESSLDIFDSHIDADTVESAAFSLCASGAYPDAVAVIKCKTSEDAAKAKEALQDRLEDQIKLFTDYTPAEMYKLEGAKVYTKGNYAIYIALSDNDKAQEIIDGKLNG